MIVCLCNGVSDRTIRRLVAGGARSVDALASTCGAGADCGACCPLLEAFVEDAHPAVYVEVLGPAHHTEVGGITCVETIRSSTP